MAVLTVFHYIKDGHIATFTFHVTFTVSVIFLAKEKKKDNVGYEQSFFTFRDSPAKITHARL